MYACAVCNDSYCPGCERAEAPKEVARCPDCGRFFSREVDLLAPPRRCPPHEKDYHANEHYAALVARSPMLRSIEAGRAAHIILVAPWVSEKAIPESEAA